MDLKPCHVCDCQRFLKQRPDILQVMHRALGVHIAFTAVHLITIKAEAVIEAFRFAGGFGDEPFAQTPKSFHFSGMNLEVGNDGAARVLGGHKNSFVSEQSYTGKSCATCYELFRLKFTKLFVTMCACQSNRYGQRSLN